MYGLVRERQRAILCGAVSLLVCCFSIRFRFVHILALESQRFAILLTRARFLPPVFTPPPPLGTMRNGVNGQFFRQSIISGAKLFSFKRYRARTGHTIPTGTLSRAHSHTRTHMDVIRHTHTHVCSEGRYAHTVQTECATAVCNPRCYSNASEKVDQRPRDGPMRRGAMPCLLYTGHNRTHCTGYLRYIPIVVLMWWKHYFSPSRNRKHSFTAQTAFSSPVSSIR